jgi:hypothetical protein
MLREEKVPRGGEKESGEEERAKSTRLIVVGACLIVVSEVQLRRHFASAELLV